ncbi:helix-turn-helix domain-containing protein, partial [Brevundimonas sp. UBA5936]
GQAAALGAWLEDQRRAGDWRIDLAVRAQVAAAENDLEGPLLNSAERRALQRRFRDRVGVAPRTLRSVFRFRRIFDHAMGQDADAASWLEAGLAAGYFDQPQMARDFRRFLGCTATAWAREQMELARRLASHSYKPAP